MEICHALEQELCDGNCGEHGQNNTDTQCDCKALDRTGTHKVQHSRRNQGGDIGVQNCRERAMESGVNGAANRLAVLQFIL